MSLNKPIYIIYNMSYALKCFYLLFMCDINKPDLINDRKYARRDLKRPNKQMLLLCWSLLFFFGTKAFVPSVLRTLLPLIDLPGHLPGLCLQAPLEETGNCFRAKSVFRSLVFAH